MLIHQGHDATSLVECRIGKMSFLYQGPQPLLQFQRFDAKCDSVSPSWEQTVSENSLVAFLWLCAPWGGLIRRLQPTRVLRSAEPSLQRSIRVAHLRLIGT